MATVIGLMTPSSIAAMMSGLPCGGFGVGTPVTDPQPGDLMANAGHAGIYIGNGLMIHAMNPVDGTKVTAVMPGMGYYRLLG